VPSREVETGERKMKKKTATILAEPKTQKKKKKKRGFHFGEEKRGKGEGPIYCFVKGRSNLQNRRERGNVYQRTKK